VKARRGDVDGDVADSGLTDALTVSVLATGRVTTVSKQIR
jgi:hypothetical protein